MYQYSGSNNGYPGYPYSSPPRPRRKRRGIFTFLLLAGLVFGAAHFTQEYREGRLTITIPGVTTGIGTETLEGEGDDFGFQVMPNDPLLDQQYALQKINASEAWKISQGRSDVIVAVIDTGIDANHPDLKDKLVKGYDFVDNDTTPTDTVGHGTFVASLIAARANDEIGISGVAPNVKIMPLKVMSQRGGSSTRIAQAIRYAADNGAQVINLSLGGPGASRSIKTAVDYATGKGVVIVAAAGNEGDEENLPNYPASFSNVVSVGATGSRDTAAAFSNYNKAVSVSAPGVNILGARSAQNQMCRPYRTTNYCVASGTSFSAPYVAGTAALMISANPKLTPAQVRDILQKSAKDLGSKGRDDFYGYGRIDAGRAVAMAKAA